MVKKLFIAIFAIALVFGKAVPVFAAKPDTQYWKQESISWNVAKNWKLGLLEEMYFKDDGKGLYHQHTELGLAYVGLAKWLEAGVNFRHTVQKSNGSWKREEQPSIHGILKATWKGYRISDRNRLEYRIKEDAEDYWVYRNLLTVSFPLEITRLKFRPFWADEFFVDFNTKELCENRFYDGFSFNINKTIGMEVYYMWRRVKSSNAWATDNVFGTRLKFSF